MNHHHFLAVGDIVRPADKPEHTAQVTRLRPDGGFDYRYDKPRDMGALGMFVGGSCYDAGLGGWVRVPPERGPSTPSTRYATANSLKRHADAMEQGAADARKMADMVAGMPDPIGPFVIEVSRELRRHGLAVINTSAIRLAIQAMSAYDPDKDEDEDHPEDTARAMQDAYESLKGSLTA